MNIRTDYPASVATITLDEDEMLDLVHLDLAVQNIILDPAGIQAIDLHILPKVMNEFSNALHDRKFVIAGTLTANAVTTMRMRRNLRVSSDGKHAPVDLGLAVPRPVLQPSREEQEARAQFDHSRYSDDVVSRNVARIEAEFRKPVEPDQISKLAEAALRTQHRREGR